MPEASISSVETLPDLLVVHVLVESLDEEHAGRLQRDMRAAASAYPRRACILNLEKVNFVPSLALGTLIRIHTEFRNGGERLIMAAVQPHVRDLFVLTRLDRLFELSADIPTATRAIRPT
jgi:anti-sigma B factor antagonist